MSISAISGADSRNSFQNRIMASTAAGTVLGAAYAAKDKHYLYKGLPTDSFVKSVSRNLQKDMTSDELKESSKIYRFVEKVVDPEVNLETLKPMIFDSKELSEAIKSSPDEKVEDAVSRVFSQDNRSKIKQDLLDLQYKTKSDKKTGRNTALKLVHDNFDASTKKLVKNQNTSEKMFDMIKSTAVKIQAKSIAATAAAVGIASGALCLIMSDVPGTKE